MTPWWKKKSQRPAAPAAIAATAAAPAPDTLQAWKNAFQHHQAGRLDEASALYRQVLEHEPNHFNALHLLGVVALQQGRLDEARDQIALAILLSPRDGAAHSNLGTVHLRAGRLAEARASLETAVRLNPKDVNANSNLGTVLLRQGQAAAAAQAFRQALAAGAGEELRNELGAALLQAGEPAAALAEYERVLVARPGHAGATVNRAILLAQLGRLDEARRDFEAVVQRNPGSPQAHVNLGALLRDMGDLEGARQSLQKAAVLAPKLFEAWFNLAGIALESGQPQQARALAEQLLKEHPRSAEALALRGEALWATGQRDEAEAALAQALAIEPRLATAHHVLGLIRMSRGDDQGARLSHEEAVRLDPSHAPARWAAVMARLPAMVDDDDSARQSQRAFAEGVQDLDRWFQGPNLAKGTAAVGSTQPFYLAYQRGNHKELLAPYGRLCQRLMAAAPRPAVRPVAESDGAIRVGIVSAHIQDHSVWTAIVRGWVAQLDPQRFELHLFSLGATDDAQTALARSLVPHFHSGPANLQEWSARIAGAAPQVLLYPEVGMDARTAKLASRRLAPLQLAAWGHPLTTAMPEIDAYISAAAFEPPGAQAHYTEELVALPGLGVHYEPLAVSPERINRAQLGLPLGAPLLLCPGLPFKYAGQDDDLWVEIAQRVPHARLVFFKGGPPELNERLAQRLKRRFAQRGLDAANHLVWLPLLTRPQFFGLMREAALFLDSLGFSGFNTAMQAVECGLPMIALEGETLRGRFGSGILREIGLDDCVAADKQQYADLAVALAQDPNRRAAIAAHMREQRRRIFATAAAVQALADFIATRVARAK